MTLYDMRKGGETKCYLLLDEGGKLLVGGYLNSVGGILDLGTYRK
jgi:hypothetical protein